MLSPHTQLSDPIYFTDGQEGRITRIARYRIKGHLITYIIVKKENGLTETLRMTQRLN